MVSEHASAQRTTSNQAPAQAQPARSGTESAGALNPRQLTAASLMQLQRTVGNQAAQGIVQRAQGRAPVVQRAGGGTPGPGSTPTVPALTPEQEQRKRDFQTARDAKAAELAMDTFNKIRANVKQQLDAYLTSDSAAATIRENVKAKVIAEISASMSGGTADQKADALKFAEASAPGIMLNKLKSYAQEVAHAQYGDDKKAGLTAEAKAVYDDVAPSASDAAFEKQKTKAAADAKKKLEGLVKTAVAGAIAASKTVIAAKFAPSSSGAAGGFDRIDVGTVGQEELDKRIGFEDKLVDQTVVEQEDIGNNQTREIKDMEHIYRTALAAPLKKAVLSKLGVGRSGFRRSKELNKYRDELKQGARSKVNSQINAEIASRSGGAMSASPNKAEFMKMATKVKAHKESKKLVDDVMALEADAIVARHVPKPETIEKLTKLAKSSAYAAAKQSNANASALSDSQKEKIRAAGVEAATAHAKELLKKKQEAAVLDARKITKGTKATAQAPASAPDAAKTAEIRGNVEDDEKTKGMAKKLIDESIAAPDITGGMNRIGRLIDLAAPNPGDAASMSVELKIPFVSAHGAAQGYFLFGFGGEAEREDGELSVGTEVTFGAGFSTFGLDANFRVGVHLEGTGGNSGQVMNLLSYGLYREMTNVSKPAAQHFWGSGGKSGDTKMVEAEKWAMMIEEQYLTAGAEVSVGYLMKIAMEANVGVAEFSADLAGKKLSAYNMDVVGKKGKDASGRVLTAEERVNAGSIGKGELRNVYDAATELEIKFGKDKVAFGLEGSLTKIDGRLREVGIALSASIPSQFGEEGGDLTMYAGKIVTAAVGAGKNLSALLAKAARPEHNRGERATGTVLDAGSDALFTGNYFDDIGTSFSEKIMGDETVNDTMRSWLPGQDDSASAIEQSAKIGLSNALQLAVEFKKEYDESGVSGGWEVTLSASQVKGLEVDAEVVKVAVEKAKRLGKISFGGGNPVAVEGLGFGG